MLQRSETPPRRATSGSQRSPAESRARVRANIRDVCSGWKRAPVRVRPSCIAAIFRSPP